MIEWARVWISVAKLLIKYPHDKDVIELHERLLSYENKRKKEIK
jgi:hypothetical protein